MAEEKTLLPHESILVPQESIHVAEETPHGNRFMVGTREAELSLCWAHLCRQTIEFLMTNQKMNGSQTRESEITVTLQLKCQPGEGEQHCNDSVMMNHIADILTRSTGF